MLFINEIIRHIGTKKGHVVKYYYDEITHGIDHKIKKTLFSQ